MVVTLPANALGVHDVVRVLRSQFRSVVLVGHSMGSWTSILEAATYQDVDGLVLTGIVHEDNEAFRSTVIESLYEAGADPKFAGQPGLEGYLTTRPVLRVGTFFHVPTAEPELLAIDEERKGTATMGEVSSFAIARSKETSTKVSVPTLVLVGAEDRFVSVTTIEPDSPELLREASWYSRDIDLRVVPAAAHNTCLHLTAPTHHAMIIEWLGDNVG
jgi:pimeloyl-ACP methyl ester carboxylesterase